MAIAICGLALSSVGPSQTVSAGGKSGKVACAKAGPQAPRDVTSLAGGNGARFAKAPAYAEMKLCDIHFHRFAEHKASGYSGLAGSGNNRGYVCNGRTPRARASGDGGHGTAKTGCRGIAEGDTVEVHWVFTTCDVEPGPTLGSCFSKTCKSPQLRVEARVFYLTSDEAAGDFTKLAAHSPGRVAPPPAVDAIEYLGSTTGDKYNDGSCSPFQVTWHVSSACSPLNLQSLDSWCGKDKNPFKEDHAHGVRRLVTDAKLLAPIE